MYSVYLSGLEQWRDKEKEKLREVWDSEVMTEDMWKIKGIIERIEVQIKKEEKRLRSKLHG